MNQIHFLHSFSLMRFSFFLLYLKRQKQHKIRTWNLIFTINSHHFCKEKQKHSIILNQKNAATIIQVSTAKQEQKNERLTMVVHGGPRTRGRTRWTFSCLSGGGTVDGAADDSGCNGVEAFRGWWWMWFWQIILPFSSVWFNEIAIVFDFCCILLWMVILFGLMHVYEKVVLYDNGWWFFVWRIGVGS